MLSSLFYNFYNLLVEKLNEICYNNRRKCNRINSQSDSGEALGDLVGARTPFAFLLWKHHYIERMLKGEKRMDIETITNLITTIGFPIVCCIIMALYIYRQELQHKEEIDSLRQSLDNNTLMLNKILTYIEALEVKTNGKSNDESE